MATLQQTTRFAAPPATLFRFYADAKEHAAVTGARASFVARPGGRFSAWDGYATGRVLQVVPGRRLVTTWRAADWRKGEPDSILVLDFASAPGGCEVSLVQVGIPDRVAAELRKGWREFYWSPWRKSLAGRPA